MTEINQYISSLKKVEEVTSIIHWGSSIQNTKKELSDIDLICFHDGDSFDFKEKMKKDFFDGLEIFQCTDIKGFGVRKVLNTTEIDIKFYSYNIVYDYVIASKIDISINERIHTLFYSIGKSKVLFEKAHKGKSLLSKINEPLTENVRNSLIEIGSNFPPISQLNRVIEKKENIAIAHYIMRLCLSISKIIGGITNQYSYSRMKGMRNFFINSDIPEKIKYFLLNLVDLKNIEIKYIEKNLTIINQYINIYYEQKTHKK
ncbi:MAG TPA: hypothetical protein PK904_07300 [Bacteroidales bacterium]|nr:hypothetical protein [Bacteroidales bacterium]